MWGGFTTDPTGTYLIAAQQPSSPIYDSPQMIYYSNDGGSNWFTSDAPAVGYYCIAAATSSPYVVAGGYNGIYVSSNYGQNWASKSTFMGTAAAATSPNGQNMAVVQFTSNKCFAYSSDYGSTWTTGLGPSGLTGNCQSVAMNADTIVLGTDGAGIYVSANGGVAWTSTYSATTGSIESITYSSNVFYAGMQSTPYYILISTDSGSTWQVTAGSQTTQPDVWQLAAASNLSSYLVVAATEMFLSTDSGATFTQETGNSKTRAVAVNGDGSLTMFNAGNNTLSYLYYGNLGK